jgi:dTDP-D-glucose 4,6-dehydratase
MHFAAQTHVDNSFGNSLSFTTNNTYGTHMLLEACRIANVNDTQIERFINVSTDEVYGETSFFLKDGEKGLSESAHLDPTNPYSAAKVGAEMICRSYMTSYKIPIIATRGNNVYGPHQYPEKVIPKFILLARKGEKLPVHGDGMGKRSYLFIDDVVDAFIIILHKGVIGETYNIGSLHEYTVLDVAQEVNRFFGLDDNITFVEDRLFNDRRYFIGSEKINQLGWKEKTSWEKGVQKTIEWYTTKNNDLTHYWQN